jgi:hypothetical protein
MTFVRSQGFTPRFQCENLFLRKTVRKKGEGESKHGKL